MKPNFYYRWNSTWVLIIITTGSLIWINFVEGQINDPAVKQTQQHQLAASMNSSPSKALKKMPRPAPNTDHSSIPKEDEHNMTPSPVWGITFDSFELAYKTAQSQKRPFLVFWSAAWCTSCQKLKKETFSSLEWRAISSQWIQAELDVDEPVSKALSDQLKIESVPTFQIFDENKKILGQLHDYQSPEILVPWLNSFSQESRAMNDSSDLKSLTWPTLKDRLPGFESKTTALKQLSLLSHNPAEKILTDIEVARSQGLEMYKKKLQSLIQSWKENPYSLKWRKDWIQIDPDSNQNKQFLIETQKWSAAWNQNKGPSKEVVSTQPFSISEFKDSISFFTNYNLAEMESLISRAPALSAWNRTADIGEKILIPSRFHPVSYKVIHALNQAQQRDRALMYIKSCLEKWSPRDAQVFSLLEKGISLHLEAGQKQQALQWINRHYQQCHDGQKWKLAHLKTQILIQSSKTQEAKEFLKRELAQWKKHPNFNTPSIELKSLIQKYEELSDHSVQAL